MLRQQKLRRYKLFGIDDLIMGGLTLAGGLFKNNSDDNRQENTNAFNAQQGAITREFNAAEAEKNRNYQTEMSNTAYQRSMADMYKAGLNPILAYQKGGASSPSGATASTGNVSAVAPKDTENFIANAASSAQHNRRLAVELENMKLQQDLTRAQTGQAMSASRVNDEVAKKTEADKNISVENLSPAKRHAVESNIERGILQNSAGRLAKQTGYSATLVKPVADTIGTAVRAATPFANRFHF